MTAAIQVPEIVKGLAISAVTAAVIVLSGCSTGTLSDDYTNPASDPAYQQAEQYEADLEAEYAANDDADRDGEPDWQEGARALDEELNERNRLLGERLGYEQQEDSSSDGKGWGGESRLRSDGEFEERCEYAPTMNYDWHDDYVCDGQRLYLLPDDEFVTEQELEQAAREWVR